MSSHESFSAFLSMSGYGGYVWSSFALTLLVMVGNYVTARRRHARMLLHLRRRLHNPESSQ